MVVARHVILLGLFFFSVTISAFAAEFVTLGPRAMGMGGAHVAVASDATAIHWNPANLSANRKAVDIRGQIGVVAKDHLGLPDLWDDVDNVLAGREIDDLSFYGVSEDVARLVEILSEMEKEGTGIDLNGQAGIFVSANIMGIALAVGGTGIGYVSAAPVIDLDNVNATLPGSGDSIADNTSAIELNGLRTIEVSLSLAHGFINNSLHVGGTLKIIDSISYFTSISAFNTSDTDIADEVKKGKRTDQALTGDLGLVWMFAERLRFGIVGKYLTGPSFSSARTGGDDIKIDPQVRTGAAFFPWPGATLALDIDVTSNETLTPGYDERQVAVGFEQAIGTKGKILGDLFSVRVGGYKNVAESGSNFVGTAGLGLGFFGMKFDIAGLYDFQNEEAGASANIAFQW